MMFGERGIEKMMQKFNPEKTKCLKAVNLALSVFFHEKKAQEPLELEQAEQLLVIDAGRIGDIVMSVPFLKTLKRNAPKAEITLLCASWAEPVLKGQGVVDRFVFFDPRAPGSLKELVRTLRQVNRIRYDAAFEPRGDLRYIFLMHFCSAKRKVSFGYTGGACLLTDVVRPPGRTVHLVEEKLYFAKQAGCRIYKADRYPTLTLSERQKKENEDFIKSHGLLDKQVIGIHPGASLKIKQWDKFGELAAKLAAGSGSGSDSDFDFESESAHMAFLIFEGPGEKEEAYRTAQAVRKCGVQAIVSQTGLTQYIQRLALCHMVFCNDSGAGHIARACGVTVFVIFGPVEPAFAKPYAKDRVIVCSDDSLACKPCFRTSCPKARRSGGTGGQPQEAGCECLQKITVREVYEKYRNVCGQVQ